MREPGLYYDVPNAEYHRGLIEVADINGLKVKPLSSTGAKTIVDKSPANYIWSLAHPKESAAFSFGTAVHELVLEGELKSIEVFTFKNWMSKEAKEAKAAALAKGKTPVLEHELSGIHAAVENVRNHSRAASLLSTGKPEVSGLVWDEEYKIWFQVRFDWLRTNGLIVDLKTSKASTPNEFNREVANYLYDLQASLYLRAAEILGLNPPGFGWVVVKNTQPFNVFVVEYSELGRAYGDQRMHTALRKYAHGIHSGEWPDWPDVYTYEPPKWLEFEGESE